MEEEAAPSSSFLVHPPCPRADDDKLMEDGEGSTAKTPARTRTTYDAKGSRDVSAEQREKWKCNVDHYGDWKW
jgi:hypothetical protein